MARLSEIPSNRWLLGTVPTSAKPARWSFGLARGEGGQRAAERTRPKIGSRLKARHLTLSRRPLHRLLLLLVPLLPDLAAGGVEAKQDLKLGVGLVEIVGPQI